MNPTLDIPVNHALSQLADNMVKAMDEAVTESGLSTGTLSPAFIEDVTKEAVRVLALAALNLDAHTKFNAHPIECGIHLWERAIKRKLASLERIRATPASE